ncbi:MAG TPA: fatty acid desaturase [Burkholderiales bacterium]|nr:fatty acid desaturase [Burkholderiales bacterium]
MELGLLNLPWWGYVLVALGLTHITIASVTIFLHRRHAHRALTLHPIAEHFFRFWLWLTTGIVTKAWVAIHRKHHAKCETAEDPHSPLTHGINKVLWEGIELYRAEARNAETLEKYGHGVPNDWIERKLYSKRDRLGITLMLTINLVLFGPLGLSIWAIQMLWIPLFAAGVINGVGHYRGYRNFASNDLSTNIVPWGLLIGGEELHNNHHAYPTSAKLSNKWWEFDIGWLYIRTMEMFGLARNLKIAPNVRLNPAKTRCDATTLRAIITHRYDVLARFARDLKRTSIEEVRNLQARASFSSKGAPPLDNVTRLLHKDADALQEKERAVLDRALLGSGVLSTIYAMRQELAALWSRSTATEEQLVQQLEAWRQRAEASGIAALQEFSRKLRCYE